MKWLLFLLMAWTVASSAAAETGQRPKTSIKTPSKSLAALAQTLPPAAATHLLDMANRGDAKSLITLPGVGEVRAAAIIAGRPYGNPLDLLRVPGIGEATLGKILKHAAAGFPTLAPKRAADPKSPT